MGKVVKIPDLVYVYADEWVGLYGDGNLLHEGVALSVKRVLEALGIPTQYREVDLRPEERFPNELYKISEIERQHKLRQARELRDQAVKLEEEAAKLGIECPLNRELFNVETPREGKE